MSERDRSVESIERRRQARLSNERARRRTHFDQAVSEIQAISKENLFYVGCALYWGEGTKAQRGTISFTNSDPRSVQLMKRFFEEICHVPGHKFRGRVSLHPHLNTHKAERYWSRVSGIPTRQFHKTTMQVSKASKGKKDSLPFGTFSIIVNDTVLYLRMMGWLEGIYTSTVPSEAYVPCRYHRFL